MLRRITERIRPGAPKQQALLNIMLANIITGIRADDLDAGACRSRIHRAALKFEEGGFVSSEKLYRFLVDEMQTDSSGWYSRKPDIGTNLDDLLLCVADQWGLAAWMGAPGTDLYKDAEQARRACRELTEALEAARRDRDWSNPLFARSVGKPSMDGMPARPLWLTPLMGPVAEIVDRAVDAPDSRWANRLCGLLGLSHIRLGSPVVAVILDRTVSDLAFDRAARLAGPTSLEAGGFQHYRHHPQRRAEEASGFGLTYELDPIERKRSGTPAIAGACEAVRSPMTVQDVLEFVYVGQTAADPPYDREPKADFLRTVGANLPLKMLLEAVGREVGMWESQDRA